jgi:S-adenosylmethionine:tRNA ribosyltransferase-isomerase
VFYIFAEINIQPAGMEEFSHPEQIRIEDYDYPLPDERIAQYPLEHRDRSKLLIYEKGVISDDLFLNIANHLPDNSLVIFNETRVIHARLLFRKNTGSLIEIFCLEPVWPYRDHQQAMQCHTEARWKCLVGNSKRWKSGEIEWEGENGGQKVRIKAQRVSSSPDGSSEIIFRWEPNPVPFSVILETAGKIPLPPYIHRKPVPGDETTYQTIYARQEGSVAAPTAGLHFSPAVIDTISAKNIQSLKFTLHIGAGTFRPVTSETIAGHSMHAEQVIMPLETLEQLKASLNKPIIAVGTTTTRMLESLYWHGLNAIKGQSEPDLMDIGQWDPYKNEESKNISREEALDFIIDGCKRKAAGTLRGSTRLLIAPGYTFRYPDILITNFHQPRSTLLLLIAAFIGDNWKKAYQFALDHEFRFLSYGDSCLFSKI